MSRCDGVCVVSRPAVPPAQTGLVARFVVELERTGGY